jgi:hypothetical protein
VLEPARVQRHRGPGAGRVHHDSRLVRGEGPRPSLVGREPPRIALSESLDARVVHRRNGNRVVGACASVGEHQLTSVTRQQRIPLVVVPDDFPLARLAGREHHDAAELGLLADKPRIVRTAPDVEDDLVARTADDRGRLARGVDSDRHHFAHGEPGPRHRPTVAASACGDAPPDADVPASASASSAKATSRAA